MKRWRNKTTNEVVSIRSCQPWSPETRLEWIIERYGFIWSIQRFLLRLLGHNQIVNENLVEYNLAQYSVKHSILTKFSKDLWYQYQKNEQEFLRKIL